jgi:hypothetical protein
MSMKDLLGKLSRIDESMKSDAKKPTGPKFPGYWKGTDKASDAKNKMVGGSAEESILKDLERALIESPSRDLMREFQEFKEQTHELDEDGCEDVVRKTAKLAAFYMQSKHLQSIFTVDEYIYKKMGVQPELVESFNSKQEVIDHFVKQGKSAAAGAAAWERGYRGTKPQTKPTDMNNFKFKKPPAKNWQELDEYGGVGGYGAASQAPTGTSAQAPDPAQQQAKLDAQQIQKSTGQLASTLNQQGAAQNLDKVKFSDTMTKLDAQPNTDLNAQELKQMEPLAVATSKALQNPQTASQMKQLISKADTTDKQKDIKVQQAQQQVGTNPPAGTQPQNQQTPVPGQPK